LPERGAAPTSLLHQVPLSVVFSEGNSQTKVRCSMLLAFLASAWW
jgi:hypothetical protein